MNLREDRKITREQVTMCKFNRGRGADIQPSNSPQPRWFRTVKQPEIRNDNLQVTVSKHAEKHSAKKFPN